MLEVSYFGKLFEDNLTRLVEEGGADQEYRNHGEAADSLYLFLDL
jgi:hypothetical protein